jgi:hydrogenase expression/formation protein HypE
MPAPAATMTRTPKVRDTHCGQRRCAAFHDAERFLEEGLEIALLRRVIDALANVARECGVDVVAGDTKVVGRGDCDGIYLAATGIGFKPRGTRFASDLVRAGDRIVVSGPIGDHGAAVMLARQEFGLRGDLKSDAASVLPQAQALMGLAGLRFMHDPTRGGLATVAHELSRATDLAVHMPPLQGYHHSRQLLWPTPRNCP